MASSSKMRSLLYGLGGLGGTVTIIAAAIDRIYGDGTKPRFGASQLSAQTAFLPQRTRWNYNWDMREPKMTPPQQEDLNSEDGSCPSKPEPKPTASRHLILIRHGQYNLAGESDEERILTTLGREQARVTGERLAELGLPYTSLARSNMARAVETAQIITAILPDVPVLPTDSILREGAPIIPEPRVGSWRPDHYYETDGVRIEAAFRKYFHRAYVTQKEDSYEIIVCHANVIRYFACRALQFPPEAWLRLSLRHASLTWMVIRPDGRVHCRALGEAGHFPPEKLTTT